MYIIPSPSIFLVPVHVLLFPNHNSFTFAPSSFSLALPPISQKYVYTNFFMPLVILFYFLSDKTSLWVWLLVGTTSCHLLLKKCDQTCGLTWVGVSVSDGALQILRLLLQKWGERWKLCMESNPEGEGGCWAGLHWPSFTVFQEGTHRAGSLGLTTFLLLRDFSLWHQCRKESVATSTAWAGWRGALWEKVLGSDGLS